jgi:hypothetical protein
MKTKMKQIKEKTTKGNLLLSVLIAVVAIVFAACSSDVVLNDIAESQTRYLNAGDGHSCIVKYIRLGKSNIQL